MRGGKGMDDKRVIVEITPLVGTEMDLNQICQEAITFFKKHPGVVVNARVEENL